MAIAKDMTGQVIGKWTVLERDPRPEKNVHWLCQCECGVKQSVSGNHLRRGNSVSCRKCSEGKDKDRLNSRVWERIKYGAKIRDLSVDVDREFLYGLYLKQGKKCALTGVSIGFAPTLKEDKKGGTTASLDRINSLLPYSETNVQWVHKDVNKMKWDFSMDRFYELCQQVTEHRLQALKNQLGVKEVLLWK